VPDKMFMLLIAIALVMLGLLSLKSSSSNCPELRTLDDFENNKTTVCERTNQ
jgi:hypothetical protein